MSYFNLITEAASDILTYSREKNAFNFGKDLKKGGGGYNNTVGIPKLTFLTHWGHFLLVRVVIGYEFFF